MRRILLRIAALVSASTAALGLASFFIVDNGLLEIEPNELKELRQRKANGALLWLERQVAWITIDGTHIDFPVMQTVDNDWYLNHDIYDKKSPTGAVFLDYRNSAEFDDAISVIYGHRTNGNTFFSDVARYSDSDFFMSHRDGELVLRKAKYRLKVQDYSVVSATSELYSKLSYKSSAKPVIVLSTCDRNARDGRDVLVLSYEPE